MPREMRVIRNVPIVQVGTWEASTGEWVVTRADIQAAVQSMQDPAVRLPRIWIGHDDARDEPGTDAGGAAVGWLSNLQATDDGDTLAADMHVPPLLADTIHAHFPSRSVEAWSNLTTATGLTHKLVIEGVALLGRELPAVETLDDIAELWGMTPDRDESPADAPLIAASRRRIVCALGGATPAPAGSDQPRQEAPMPTPAPAEAPTVPAPEAQAPAPEPTPTTPAPEAEAPAPGATATTPEAPEAPQIPDGFRLVEQGVWDDIQARLEQVDTLVADRTEREADEYVGELIAAGRIAASSRQSIAEQYREDPARTRAICDLLPERTHEPPPTGRVAAQRGDDTNPTASDTPSLITFTPAERNRLGMNTEA